MYVSSSSSKSFTSLVWLKHIVGCLWASAAMSFVSCSNSDALLFTKWFSVWCIVQSTMPIDMHKSISGKPSTPLLYNIHLYLFGIAPKYLYKRPYELNMLWAMCYVVCRIANPNVGVCVCAIAHFIARKRDKMCSSAFFSFAGCIQLCQMIFSLSSLTQNAIHAFCICRGRVFLLYSLPFFSHCFRFF